MRNFFIILLLIVLGMGIISPDFPHEFCNNFQHNWEYICERLDIIGAAESSKPFETPPNPAPAQTSTPNPAPVQVSQVNREDSGGVYGIRVTGEPWFHEKVRQAIKLLQERDPEAYRLVTDYIREIDVDGTIPTFAQVYVTTGTVQYKPWKIEDPESMASTLVHEAMHIHLYRHNLPYLGEQAEKICCERAQKALISIQNYGIQ
ncbi:MAG: hypothetical protein K6U74_02210 [Firmicutes bacterium]|nr:hypothetical protein [Bacillota bacterium]